MRLPIVDPNRLKLASAELDAFLRDWKEPEPAFTFSLGWAADYDDLLQERVTPTGTDEILQRVLLTGRVLISGRGGAAKTTLVYRLVRGLLKDPSVFPVILNLKSWITPFYEEWKSAPEDFTYRMELLLSRVAIPKINLAVLDALDPTTLRLIVADGLNEITPAVAQEIIGTLDEYVRRAHQSGVIITDRVVRRYLADPMRWSLCTVLPLPVEEVEKHLTKNPSKLAVFTKAAPSVRNLLSTPLFLDQFLRSGQATGLLTTAAQLEFYFQERIGLQPNEMEAAAQAAYSAYTDQSTRTFPITDFEKRAGTPVTNKLTAAGTIQVRNGLGFFNHHLHHDYLVSRVLVESERSWGQAAFDTVTFKAASFDVLALTLEQLQKGERVDLFLQKLYDWNVYAPGYALAEAQHGGEVRVSVEMEAVILAMLAERRWDFFLGTAERATDALSIFPRGSQAQQFLDTKNLGELFDKVWRVNTANKAFNEWRRLFTHPANEGLSDDTLYRLIDNDSIIGWTLANVLKRVPVTDGQVLLLHEWIKEFDKNETILWRIAHVLGSYPSENNVRALLAIFLRRDVHWASKGALRSLVETAGRSTDPRWTSLVFNSLAVQLDRLLEPETLREFERLFFVRTAPPTWTECVIRLVQEIYSRQSDDAERTRWIRTTQDVAKRYGRAGSPALP